MWADAKTAVFAVALLAGTAGAAYAQTNAGSAASALGLGGGDVGKGSIGTSLGTGGPEAGPGAAAAPGSAGGQAGANLAGHERQAMHAEPANRRGHGER